MAWRGTGWRSLAAGLAMALVSCPSLAGGDFDRGVQAYEKGAFDSARTSWEKALAGGDWEAARNLGTLYRRGLGVTQNDARAAEYYGQAVHHGVVAANLNLAEMFLAGRGVPRDVQRAKNLLRKAVRQGMKQAQFRLDDIEKAEARGEAPPALPGFSNEAPSSAGAGTTPAPQPSPVDQAATEPPSAPEVAQTPAEVAPVQSETPAQDAPSSAEVPTTDAAPPPPPPSRESAPPPASMAVPPWEAAPSSWNSGSSDEGVSPSSSEAAGTPVRAYIASYRSEKAAAEAWRSLDAPSLMADLEPVTIPGKGRFVRLYARGPADAVKRLCAALASGKTGGACKTVSPTPPD